MSFAEGVANEAVELCLTLEVGEMSRSFWRFSGSPWRAVNTSPQ